MQTVICLRKQTHQIIPWWKVSSFKILQLSGGCASSKTMTINIQPKVRYWSDEQIFKCYNVSFKIQTKIQLTNTVKTLKLEVETYSTCSSLSRSSVRMGSHTFKPLRWFFVKDFEQHFLYTAGLLHNILSKQKKKVQKA